MNDTPPPGIAELIERVDALERRFDEMEQEESVSLQIAKFPIVSGD